MKQPAALALSVRVLPAMLALALLAGPVLAADQGPAGPPQRWQGDLVGLSVLPPTGTTTIENAADESLVKFARQDGIVFTIFVRKVETALQATGRPALETLKRLKLKSVQQMNVASPSNVLIDDPKPSTIVADRAAEKTFFLLPKTDEKGNWVLGQAIFLIDAFHVGVMQVECDERQYRIAKADFEEMLASARLRDPEELAKERKAILAASDIWLQSVDSTSRELWLAKSDWTEVRTDKQLGYEKWYRIVEGTRDVGYQRVRFGSDEQFDMPGFRVTERQAIFVNDVEFSTTSDCWAANARTNEFWSIRTTGRREAPTRGLPGNQQRTAKTSSAETGAVTGQKISISTESPTGPKHIGGVRPARAYLTQADLRVYEHLLPHDKPQTMMFFTFNSQHGQITMRIVRIRPLADGGYEVRTRPAPNRGEQVSTYDSKGLLVRRAMADGRVIIPATPDELKRIWNRRFSR